MHHRKAHAGMRSDVHGLRGGLQNGRAAVAGHGSLFAPDGALLNGPAVRSLAAVPDRDSESGRE